MNAVVYARFSSHRQGEQSIEGQVAEAERFAAAHGLTIVKVYADRAQTGRNDNREQFQLMLADAAKHAFDALIVWKTDRIGRNKEEIALNKYHLKKNGVKIYYVAEAIPDTPEGIILEAVIEGMAAYYSEQLSQNVRRGMKTSAQKGQYTGGTCPLGYTINADKKYEIDPKYAPVVREIFQLYSEGKTITEIVKILNDKGLRTSRGHAFTHNSLRTVLKNKKYIGTYEYNGEVSIENSVPPIVDVDVFNKVQDLLAFNQKAGAHKKAKVDYILFGKIFCGKCGAGMTGICGTSKQKVKHHYYICSAKKKKLCTKRAVRQDWIETLVLKHLLKLVRNEELLEFIAENTYQYFLAQNTDTTYTKSLQKALDETDRAINNLLRAIEAGIFNESTKDRMNELEEQKKELRVALAAAKLKEDLGLKKEHIVFFLHQFAGMDYSDINCQKQLIKTFLNSVFVYDDKVVLTFNYSGDERIMTLHEIDGGLGHSICIPSAVVHQKRHTPFGVCLFLIRNEIPCKTRAKRLLCQHTLWNRILLCQGEAKMYHNFSMTQIIEHLKAPGRKNFILDTDAYNEIDDQFAITYAMLSDNIKLLALTSAPFFNRRVRSVSEGQQKSFEEMTRIRDLIDPEGERNIPCYHGADGYLPDIHTPCPSEAVENIIRIVKEADGIVYFGMLGCFTNMASALLTEPSIREKVVVIMIGANRFGYHTNNEFNLMQDRAAARVILECGVPVVVLPAMEATERITTTTGEVYYYLKGKTGNIGNYLCKIYAEDEWVPDDAEGNCCSSQRSLWDLAAVALLRLADQIGDLQIVPAKTISQDGVLWVELGDGRQMLYVDQFNRNRIMSDFFTTLRKAYL